MFLVGKKSLLFLAEPSRRGKKLPNNDRDKYEQNYRVRQDAA